MSTKSPTTESLYTKINDLRDKLNDLTKRDCRCGGVMVEIIGFEESKHIETPLAVRKGWYCFDCRAWEKAIFRETTVK